MSDTTEDTRDDRHCPACRSGGTETFFTIDRAPVFCNVLHDTRESAAASQIGRISLAWCPECSLIFNAAFDPELVRYAPGYENALHFSPTFSAYAEKLARGLIERHALQGGVAVEVGCGDGRFLRSLVENGMARGLGFDPSLTQQQIDAAHPRVRLCASMLSPDASVQECDLLCCRHVLEHIDDPRRFVRELIASLHAGAEPLIFFEVPNALWTIRDLGVWDVIYEHCLYFSPRAIRRLFERCSLRPLHVETHFNEQFLTIEASRRRDKEATHDKGHPDSGAPTRDLVESFAGEFESRRASWHDRLTEWRRTGEAAVVWGAGSKGVMFANHLDPDGRLIKAIIDLNPRKHHRFIPATGHEVLPPEALPRTGPSHIIVMNPNYADEIRQHLAAMSVDANVHVV